MAEIINLKVATSKSGCPKCGKPQSPEFRPFCSKRCADLDLGKWLNEDYRIASQEESNSEDDPYEQD